MYLTGSLGAILFTISFSPKLLWIESVDYDLHFHDELLSDFFLRLKRIETTKIKAWIIPFTRETGIPKTDQAISEHFEV